jgi:hypothetical protein
MKGPRAANGRPRVPISLIQVLEGKIVTSII